MERSLFALPKAKEKAPVETDLMRRTVRKTLDAIQLNGLIGWSGRSRVGKTTTARWLVRQINDAYDVDDDTTFRAHHYETGLIGSNTSDPQKSAVRSLYAQVHGVPLSDSAYRRLDAADIAEQTVRGLARKRLRLILVDEAGLLSVDAIRGMVLVSDAAENARPERWHMTITLIGMDDLATKVHRNAQIKGRIYDWCYFKEYSLSEVKALLAALHPHFEHPEEWPGERHQEAEYIYEQCGGYPGEIAKFLRHVDARHEDLGRAIDLRSLEAVRHIMVRDMKAAIKDVRANHTERVRNPKEKNAKGHDVRATKAS